MGEYCEVPTGLAMNQDVKFVRMWRKYVDTDKVKENIKQFQCDDKTEIAKTND